MPDTDPTDENKRFKEFAEHAKKLRRDHRFEGKATKFQSAQRDDAARRSQKYAERRKELKQKEKHYGGGGSDWMALFEDLYAYSILYRKSPKYGITEKIEMVWFGVKNKISETVTPLMETPYEAVRGMVKNVLDIDMGPFHTHLKEAHLDYNVKIDDEGKMAHCMVASKGVTFPKDMEDGFKDFVDEEIEKAGYNFDPATQAYFAKDRTLLTQAIFDEKIGPALAESFKTYANLINHAQSEEPPRSGPGL